MAEPTAREQLILELINRARMDPAGEAQRLGIDLNKDLAPGTIKAAPKQVLAGNWTLNTSANSHSKWMLDHDVFSHTGAGGSDGGTRMSNAGYVFNGSWSWGENIAWSGTTGTLNADAAAAQHHDNLFRSAGHRENILNDNFREVGIGTLTGQFTSGTTYNAQMTTENFASSGTNHFVTGVVYDDTNGDNFYSLGEGRGARAIELWKNEALALATTSATAGGYGLGTTLTGDIELRFSGGGIVGTMGAAVTLGSTNIKIDLIGDDTIYSNVSTTLTQQSTGLKLIGIENVNGAGNGLANAITGNAGSNALDGGAGRDTLKGCGGADLLTGGAGADRLTGNAGADQFIFKSVAEIKGDVITDFGVGGDRIDLSFIDAVAGGADNPFHIVNSFVAGGAGALGQLSFHQTLTQTWIEGDINGDGTADFILKLAGLKSLTLGDFIL